MFGRVIDTLQSHIIF